MPPQRTIPPAKAIKTERTHEENQERAYIAASRRSDRSLEARVESARRASEIHKRRTGRSLRVTEQDVVNEEMYEEEDDDLPMQYRRLTAHLQTGSADFNRRLAAYLTNHVAMRSALDQAITNSYAQQYPNAPQFAHNQQTMFPSPLMPQNLMQQSQQQSPVQSHLPQQKPHQQAQHSPHPYRHAPYPAPGTPGYRQHSHHRSMPSASTPHEVPGFVQNFSNKSPVEVAPVSDVRRMSMPVASMKPADVRTPQPSQPSQPSRSSQSPPMSVSKKSPITKQECLTPQPMRPPPTPQYNANTFQDFSPFSTALPSESQMLLGSSLDTNDPLTSMFMAGSESLPQHFYDFNSQFGVPKFHPSYDGLNSTLAPSALDISPDSATYSDPSPATTESATTPPYSYNFDGCLLDYKGVSFAPANSAHASGTATPGNDGGWDNFINDNSWSENAT